MKFLVIAKQRPSDLPPQTLAAMLTEAKTWVDDRRGKGEFDALYAFVEGGGVAIANHDSHESLNAAIQDYPLSPVVEWDIHPLCEFDRSIELGLAQLQHMVKRLAA